MNKFTKFLKDLFIGERKTLPTIPNPPPPINVIREQSKKQNKELGCFAKGIIKSLDDDNEPWTRKYYYVYGAYAHQNGIIVNRSYSDDDMGNDFTIYITPTHPKLSDYDLQLIFAAFENRDARAEKKIKDAVAAKIQPSIDYFNKLGCE